MKSRDLGNKRASPRLLFVTLKDFVGSERLVAALSRNGLDCAVLGWPGDHCARSRFVSRRFFLPPQFGVGFATLFLRRRLITAFRAWQPDLIIPVDDIAARALRLLARSENVPAALRELLVRSLGAPEGYAASCDRAAFMEIARQANLSVPATSGVQSPEQADAAAHDFGYPVVLKRDGTSGGAGVDIATDPRALKDALGSYKRRTKGLSLKACVRAARRLMAHLAGLDSLYADPLTLQKHISGKLAMRTVLAWNGKSLGGASFEAIKVNPEPTGPSTVIRPISNPEMDAAADRIVETLKCSGFVSFDFILGDGRAYLIEMNARPIPSIHLSHLAGTDLCALLARHLRGEAPPQLSECKSGIRIALFPSELERDPESPYAWSADSTVLHDVPWTDEPIMRLYLRTLSRKRPTQQSHLEAFLRRQESAAAPARAACGDSSPAPLAKAE